MQVLRPNALPISLLLAALSGCAVTARNQAETVTTQATTPGSLGEHPPRYPAIAGPHVFGTLADEGAYLNQAMGAIAVQYTIGLQNLNPAADVVRRCYSMASRPPKMQRDDYRSCIALDYMFDRDRRYHRRTREVTQDPYFSESAFDARWERMMRWGGFANAGDMFEFSRFAWSHVEPRAINYLRLQNLHYLD